MSSETLEPGLNRRRFIKGSLAAAAAATATGLGAAVLHDKKTAVGTNPLPQLPLRAISLPTEPDPKVDELFSQLATVQADNVRLESQLNIAKRQLESKRTTLSSRERSESEMLRDQVDELNLQVGALSGLVALFDQLDEIDLDDIVDDGLSVVGSAFDELTLNLPTVSEGLALGQAALKELEQHIPLLEDGRDWLDGHLSALDSHFVTVNRTLQSAIDGGGTVIHLLNEWFQDILKWLPFGIGKKAVDVMEALSNLINEIPNTVGGVQENIVQPLDVWLSREDEQTALQRRVVAPVRDSALTPAADTISKTETLRSTYVNDLAAPARRKLARKRAVRHAIKEYREQYLA